MSKSYNLISAFTPPPNGWIRARKNGKVYAEKFIEDFRTYERYKEYKDCGFDEIIFAGEDKYQGEDYETSDLKKMLDLAEKADLNAVVFDERILGATVRAQEKLVGELFESEDELDAFVLDCVKDYSKHPAFYGVSIIDEPFIAKVQVIHDIAKSFKRVLPNAFVHTCFNPLSCVEGGPMQEVALGPGETGYEAYGNYIDAMSVPELGYWGYDDYPFKWWEGISMVPKYITTMQFVAKRCKKNGLPYHMTIQSYADSAKDRRGRQRTLTQAHFYWLANLALGFGAKKIYYYTYWRFSTRNKLEKDDLAIMDEDGSKIFYDEVQNTNKMIKSVFEYVKNYTYESSQLLLGYCMNEATQGLETEDFKLFTEAKVETPVLINKLTCDNKRIFMLQNVRHPDDNDINCVRLKIRNAKKSYNVIVHGRKTVVDTWEGELSFALEPGEAVWFLDL